MDLLYEDETVAITGSRATPDDPSFISFTGFFPGRVATAKEEFIGAAAAYQNKFFVKDKTKSWGNNLSPQRIADVVGAPAQSDEVDAGWWRNRGTKYAGASILRSSWIGNRRPAPPRRGGEIARNISFGNSMGGTNAISFSDATASGIVVAFTPQYTVHPRFKPAVSDGWREAIASIKKWRFRAISEIDRVADHCYVFHGGTPEELWHARRFARDGRFTCFSLADFGHDLARQLKRRHLLRDLVALCAARSDRSAIAGFLQGRGVRILERVAQAEI